MSRLDANQDGLDAIDPPAKGDPVQPPPQHGHDNPQASGNLGGNKGEESHANCCDKGSSARLKNLHGGTVAVASDIGAARGG
jgi:hypothetical protein